MSAGVDDPIPLDCVPSAIAPEERAAHVALIRKLFGEVAQEHEPEVLPSGYAFRFPADALGLVAALRAQVLSVPDVRAGAHADLGIALVAHVRTRERARGFWKRSWLSPARAARRGRWP